MHPVHPLPGPASQEPDSNDRPNWFQRCRKNISDLVERMDDGVSKTPVGRLFRLKGSGHVSGKHPNNFSSGVANTISAIKA
jgi:hypothetical protein